MKLAYAIPLALALLSAPACYSGPGARVVQTEALLDGRARVVAHRVDGNIFKFSVENLSNETMNVDRDAVTLMTKDGSRTREPGGADATYTIPPGGAHDVYVKFDLSDLSSGDDVTVRFGSAIHIGGKSVPVDPIAFTIQ